MENPFELIMEKLDRIERMLLNSSTRNYSPIAAEGEQPTVLTMKQAAAFTGLSTSRIYKLTSTRGIPHYKQGKKLYFKRAELNEWLTQNRISTVAEIEREATNYVIRNRRR